MHHSGNAVFSLKTTSMSLRNFYLFILLSFSIAANAQVTDTLFSKEWIGIDTLIIKNDLTRSALEKVNALYQKAKQRQLPGQVIKSLIYRYTLENRISDNNFNLIISILQSEIRTAADETQKAILYSLLAKQYRDYFNNHRWNLYNRKNTSGLKKDDMATWSSDDFTAAITDNFLRSLRDRSLLLKTNIDLYDAVVIRGNNRKLRPTLFDLLAHEALDYLKTGETYLTKPAYAFVVNDANTLGSIADFINTIFITKDSSSQQWIALQLFQQLMLAHQNDADKNALMELNIERIEWVYQHAIFSTKEAAYLKALQEITTQYGSTPSASQAWYLLARQDANKASGYTPFGDTTNRYGYVKAKQIINKALSLSKESNNGTINMQNLLQEIARKELRTEIEKANIPGKPFRALVSYRNVDTLYGRIFRVDNNENINDQEWKNDYWKTASGLKPYKTFIQVLPPVNDHQLHHTEIKIDGLAVGGYTILCSNNPSFNDSLDKLSIQSFAVSNISYIKNKNDFFVVNRDNGKPMADVKVTILKKQYINRLNRYINDTVGIRITNKNGYFNFTPINGYGDFMYSFTLLNDRFNSRQADYIYQDNSDESVDATDLIAGRFENNNNKVFFFTDRAIYRPGQTVFFKGIAITKDYKTKFSRLISNKDSAWVYLNNVNGKKIDSAKFSLNDYGSFSGKFTLPQNGLTGNFSISVTRYNQSSTYFSVEEYKRPTFNVSFEKAKGAYRLNDSVTITGLAKAYAGNNIDGAKVVYTVTRNTRYREPWLWRRPNPSSGNREISHGEISTDAEGKFSISFKALADDMADRGGNPLFDFSITADVTDINGETRSSNTQLTVGYTSLLLNISAPSLTEVDSFKVITITNTNLSNEKEPAIVHVKIYSLQTPNHPIRKRYWTRPDQFVMNRQEFTSYFPSDEYEEETNYLTWTVGELVMEGTVDTNIKELLAISPRLLKPGYYRIEAVTKDKYGDEVKATQYTQLFSSANNQLAVPAYQFNYTIKGLAEPGQTASFISASMADHLFVIRKTDKPRNKAGSYSFIERNKGFETINYTPDEADRGGVNISEAFVYDNRVYSNQYYITVPWNNKVLKVNYASYRNKTEPGSNEKWTVTVQSDKNEKVAAELLTGMYDASLDQFRQQNWNAPNIWETNYSRNDFSGISNFSGQGSRENYIPQPNLQQLYVVHDHLAMNGSELWDQDLTRWYNNSTIYLSVALKQSLDALEEVVVTGNGASNRKDLAGGAVNVRGNASMNQTMLKDETAKLTTSKMYTNAELSLSASKNENGNDNINTGIRKNFNETAFFFPQLYADTSGRYNFSFIMPEALTQWKWMSVAHTKDLAFGSYSTNIITQKTLMVQPNAPRFMREGDNMELSGKIVNLGDKELTGQVTLELIDATTNTSVDGWFQNVFPLQYFTVEAGKSSAIKFPIQIPFSFNRPLTWRIVAKSGNFSDGEENTLPVLTNRTLVTESLPLFLQTDTTQTFKFDKLLNNTSETLTHEGLTVEYTSNPVWYAVQALPYLMEYPYECAEQTFNRFYANTLASFIVNKHPRIKQVFEQWKADTSSLKSNLQKNEELKQLLLQETPWVLQAESEEQQKKNIALLFDLVKLSSHTDALIEKIRQLQLPDGSFSWFKGGYSDRYMTNYILTGIGKLKRLGALTPDVALRIRTILVGALKYADSKIAEDYNWLIKNKVDLTKQQLSTSHIDYLYMRSFFGDVAQQSPDAYAYFYKQGKEFWVKQNSFYKAELGLIYYRNKEEKFAAGTILPALLENTVTDSKQGMYWKSSYTGFWYQSPIEHQSMMIAFMSELNLGEPNTSMTKNINAMKTWLLLNKQTNNWKTTIATADACYALLLNGTDWLGSDKKVTIRLGNYAINSSNEKTEAGTGYFKKRIDGKQVRPEMGNILVTTHSTISPIPDLKILQSPSWGSVYWQYFEDLDKITAAASPLSLTKKLFIERNTDKGKILELIKEGDELKTGNKVVIRMELRTDRDMDYLHLKDMRAASMEPVNVLSSYKWQDGLGYYESTKDASSNFFISHLQKGTYVFEYPVFITHTGIFSVGIATIQCMYAPEFTSHSGGIKIRVVN